MSNIGRGRRVIDLRKRRPGASARAQAAQAALPLHRRNSLRTRRRKLRALTALFILVLVWGAVYGVSELSYLPRYSINKVRVEGTDNVSPRLVHAFVETKLNDGTRPIISRENIFLYPKAEIAKSISDYFPRILSAEISRESLLAQAITVSIAERKLFAMWCSDGKMGNRQKSGYGKEAIAKECFEMDNTGFVFAPLEVARPKGPSGAPAPLEARPHGGLPVGTGPLTGPARARLLTGFAPLEASPQSTSTDAVVFTGGLATSTTSIGQTFLPKHFAGVLALLSRLKDEGFLATGVSVENEQDFSISLSERFVIRATFGQDANLLVRNLQVILSSESLHGKENEIEYIDLRFGNRVYYKNR